MGVASGCGEQEVGVASGSGWNLWVWLLGVVVRRPHTFHPLSTIFINTFNLCKVQSMDDNCGEWVECMGVASGYGEQEAGVASGSG